jgi:chemotaxis protein CheC
MNFSEKITSLHLDVLKEIGNIGAAHAATALSDLLQKKVDMRVPNVQMVSFNDMMELAGGSENVVVGIFLRIEGDAEGSMFFILPVEQANRFIRRLIRDESFDFHSPGSVSELGLSAMQEMGNILSGSYLSALSDFTGLKIFPTVPGLSVDMFGAIISIGLIELSQVSDTVIVINTSIYEDKISDDEEVKGHFFLLPDPDSFEAIFKALGVPTS